MLGLLQWGPQILCFLLAQILGFLLSRSLLCQLTCFYDDGWCQWYKKLSSPSWMQHQWDYSYFPESWYGPGGALEGLWGTRRPLILTLWNKTRLGWPCPHKWTTIQLPLRLLQISGFFSPTPTHNLMGWKSPPLLDCPCLAGSFCAFGSFLCTMGEFRKMMAPCLCLWVYLDRQPSSTVFSSASTAHVSHKYVSYVTASKSFLSISLLT